MLVSAVTGQVPPSDCHFLPRFLTTQNQMIGAKRARDDVAEAAASLRAALASRVGPAPPSFWRTIATRGADAFMLDIGRAVKSALDAVSINAASSRARLAAVREALLASVNMRCDELESAIASSECTKVSALEHELIAIDSSLEGWRAAVSDISDLDDANLLVKRDELESRLHNLNVNMRALPTAAVELPLIELKTPAMAELLSSIAAFGIVISPRAINDSGLVVEGLPLRPTARPGGLLLLHIVLRPHVALVGDDLAASLSAAAAGVNVDASIGVGGVARHLHTQVNSDVASARVDISISIPGDAPAGSIVTVHSVRFAGASLAAASLPATVNVIRGVLANAILMNDDTVFALPTTPCISSSGAVYAPMYGSPCMAMFDADGFTMPSIPVSRLGLSGRMCWSAVVDVPEPILLLADSNGHGHSSQLVAVHPTTFASIWVAEPGGTHVTHNCSGIAVLPQHGVVIAADHFSLHAHRLDSGVCEHSLSLKPNTCFYLASHHSTGVVFCGDYYSPRVWSWLFEARVGFVARGLVASLDTEGSKPSILAVMPAAHGSGSSHLIVGTCDGPQLRVLSLPDLVLVHTHTLEGMGITGLAADPNGEAIAVCDTETNAIHVLAWPLAGMIVMPPAVIAPGLILEE